MAFEVSSLRHLKNIIHEGYLLYSPSTNKFVSNLNGDEDQLIFSPVSEIVGVTTIYSRFDRYFDLHSNIDSANRRIQHVYNRNPDTAITDLVPTWAYSFSASDNRYNGMVDEYPTLDDFAKGCLNKGVAIINLERQGVIL